MVAITKATDIVLKQNQPDNKELLTTLTDGIALAMNCLHDMNSTRHQSMKRDLHSDYVALWTAIIVPSSSEFLFGDLSKLTKDISDANKLTKKVRPASRVARNIHSQTITLQNETDALLPTLIQELATTIIIFYRKAALRR